MKMLLAVCMALALAGAAQANLNGNVTNPRFANFYNCSGMVSWLKGAQVNVTYECTPSEGTLVSAKELCGGVIRNGSFTVTGSNSVTFEHINQYAGVGCFQVEMVDCGDADSWSCAPVAGDVQPPGTGTAAEMRGDAQLVDGNSKCYAWWTVEDATDCTVADDTEIQNDWIENGVYNIQTTTLLPEPCDPVNLTSCCEGVPQPPTCT